MRSVTPTSPAQHDTARVYRMKRVDLLKRKGCEVDDHTLTSREAISVFKPV